MYGLRRSVLCLLLFSAFFIVVFGETNENREYSTTVSAKKIYYIKTHNRKGVYPLKEEKLLNRHKVIKTKKHLKNNVENKDNHALSSVNSLQSEGKKSIKTSNSNNMFKILPSAITNPAIVSCVTTGKPPTKGSFSNFNCSTLEVHSFNLTTASSPVRNDNSRGENSLTSAAPNSIKGGKEGENGEINDSENLLSKSPVTTTEKSDDGSENLLQAEEEKEDTEQSLFTATSAEPTETVSFPSFETKTNIDTASFAISAPIKGAPVFLFLLVVLNI